MKFNTQRQDDSIVEIEIELTDEEVGSIREADPKATDEVVRKNAIAKFFWEAVQKEGVAVLTPPVIDLLEEKPLRFKARFTTMPEVIAPDYKSITVKVPEMKPITDRDVEFAMQTLARQVAKKEPSEAPAANGNLVVIEYTGRDDKDVIQMASSQQVVFLGSGGMLPEFETQLEGTKVGDEKTFDITFPQDYFKKDLQGKTLHFKVKVLVIQTVEMPEMGDAFAAQVIGEGKTLEELKTVLKHDLEKQRQRAQAQHSENQVLEQIVANTKVDVPPSLLDMEIDALMESLYRGAEKQGIKREDYDEALKKEGRDPRKQLRQQAEKNVILRLALDHVLKAPEFQIEDAEVTAFLDKQEKVPVEQKDALRPRVKRTLQLQKLLAVVLGAS